MHIFMISVLKDFQWKGIGKGLIKHLAEHCKKNDFEEVFVRQIESTIMR